MANQFNILDYTDGPLLKTGQTTDYTPAGRTTRDDGGFQRGIEGSKFDNQYVVLVDGQYAGTTNITVNGFTDVHSNECVFDKVTGLMWSRNDSPGIYGVGTEDLFWDDTAGSNEDIFEYCDSANTNNLSGFSDWRLPNCIEIRSLNIFEFPNAGPNSTVFINFTGAQIWSTTTRPNDIAWAYVQSFTSGNTPVLSKTGSRNKALLCRLGVL